MAALQDVFRNAARLPHLPEVMVELDRATRGEGQDSRAIAAVVAKDPAVAAKVLRLANSAFYGRSGSIGSLEKAIQLIGISDFRTMVMVSCAFSIVREVPGVDLRQHWAHSSLTGFLAASISELSGRMNSAAFAAGLFHSMGALLLHLTMQDEALRVDAIVAPLDFPARVPAERELLGFDHAQVGGELLTRWQMPPNLCAAVEKYPQHLFTDGPLAACVYCGSIFATGSIKGISVADSSTRIGSPTLDELGIGARWLQEELKRSAEQAEDLVAMLN